MATTDMETTMDTLRGINTRQLGIFGLAALGLALTAPVQAAPDFVGGAFIVATRDHGDEVRQDQRDTRREPRRDERRDARRDRGDEPQGYGYGYERRQQQQIEEDSRARGRR